MLLPFKFFIKKDERDRNKKKISPAVMFIPSLCDVCATVFDSTGLIYVSLIYFNIKK